MQVKGAGVVTTTGFIGNKINIIQFLEKVFWHLVLTLFTIRISIWPLPSEGGDGKGFGQEPAGTHIQCVAVLTMLGVIVPDIS